jgi:hypothetical protein
MTDERTTACQTKLFAQGGQIGDGHLSARLNYRGRASRGCRFMLGSLLRRPTTDRKTYPCACVVGETARCSKYIGTPRNYIFTFVVYLVVLRIKKSGGQGAPRAR